MAKHVEICLYCSGVWGVGIRIWALETRVRYFKRRLWDFWLTGWRVRLNRGEPTTISRATFSQTRRAIMGYYASGASESDSHDLR